jgi:hypothetical protein
MNYTSLAVSLHKSLGSSTRCLESIGPEIFNVDTAEDALATSKCALHAILSILGSRLLFDASHRLH